MGTHTNFSLYKCALRDFTYICYCPLKHAIMSNNQLTKADMTTRKTPEQQLADLHHKEGQLKARIQKKQAEVSKQARKKDTRRKIVAGAIALEHMQHDPNFATAMKRLLQEHVTDRDRPLFNL